MSETSKVIQFPGTQRIKKRTRGKRRIKNIDGIKYFTGKQIKLLRRNVRDQAELGEKKGKVTGIREWMAVDLLTSSGLRVSETADLRVGDLRTGYGQSAIYVYGGDRPDHWGVPKTPNILCRSQ